MKRLITLLLPLLLPLLAQAQYKLHDFNGQIAVERAGKSVAVQKGMDISNSDTFVIPDGGSVEILETKTSQIFKSQSAGRFATSRIIFEARTQASNTGKAINSKLRFGRNDSNKSETVYVEKGRVTRSMEVFDPEARNMQVDPMKLCEHVAGAIRNRSFMPDEKFPVKLTHNATTAAGLKFAIENSMDFPVYFNVLKVKDSDGQIEISELGQPGGNYVLRPNQTLAREQFSDTEQGCTHILIMTHCYFDIDHLVENLEAMLKQTQLAEPDANLPVYLQAL